MKIALAVEYDGAEYHGWQRQKHDTETVQEKLETAIAYVANDSVNLVCSGRTDAGVHGCEQIAHFETTVSRTSKSWVFGINSRLPENIRVNWAIKVPDDFHARFNTTARRYHYVIYTSPIRPALLSKYVSWCQYPLDVVAMAKASKYLEGEHDFTSYRAVACQNKQPVKTIHHATVKQYGHYIVLDIQASGFLMHMVRNIAGVLIKIGSGTKQPIWAKEVLEAKNRTAADRTASPYGLYFVRAYYDGIDFPMLPLGPSFLNKPLIDANEDAIKSTVNTQLIFNYHKDIINSND